MDHISGQDIILYAKDAQLLKTYTPEEAKTHLVNEMGTHFGKPREYGPVFEVVRDKFPRKLVVNVTDLNDSQIQQMKNHILEFLQLYPSFKDVQSNDCKIYRHLNVVRYTFNRIVVANKEERQNILEDLYLYLSKKYGDEFTSKLQMYVPPSEFRGASLHPLPSNMTPVGLATTKQAHDEAVKYLLTSQSTEKTITFNVSINNVSNINSNNVNSTVASHNLTNVTNKTKIKVGKDDKDNVGEFVRYVCENKPDWYKEKHFVDIKVIKNAYNELLDGNINSTVISKYLQGKMFHTGSRSNNITTKRLVSYKDLEKHIPK